MNLVKDIFKQVLEHSTFVGYVFFVASLENFITDMLDEVSKIEPGVNEIRRIVQLSQTEVMTELSDIVKQKEGHDGTDVDHDNGSE